MRSTACIALALAVAAGVAAAADTHMHVHLALSTDVGTMYVQWTTPAAAADENAITWGSSPSALTNTASGEAWTFVDSTLRTYHFHRGAMTGLTAGATVFYRVGGPSGLSDVHSFVATRAASSINSAAPLRIAVLGDLGVDNAQALPFLLNASAAREYDHFIHVGDYACACSARRCGGHAAPLRCVTATAVCALPVVQTVLLSA